MANDDDVWLLYKCQTKQVLKHTNQIHKHQYPIDSQADSTIVYYLLTSIKATKTVSPPAKINMKLARIHILHHSISNSIFSAWFSFFFVVFVGCQNMERII